MKKIDIFKIICKYNVFSFCRYLLDNDYRIKILMKSIEEDYEEENN